MKGPVRYKLECILNGNERTREPFNGSLEILVGDDGVLKPSAPEIRRQGFVRCLASLKDLLVGHQRQRL